MSEVAQPLRDLIAKEAKVICSSQHAKAFKKIRELFAEHPVLKYNDPSEEVTIQCDASEEGLAAALMQNGQPVAFASRTLSRPERQYVQIEKERLAIVFACDKFSQYIAGRDKTTVKSDHKPLEFIFQKSVLSAPCRLQRMLLRLQRYNTAVQYKPGPKVYIAYHLLRSCKIIFKSLPWNLNP